MAAEDSDYAHSSSDRSLPGALCLRDVCILSNKVKAIAHNNKEEEKQKQRDLKTDSNTDKCTRAESTCLKGSAN